MSYTKSLVLVSVLIGLTYSAKLDHLTRGGKGGGFRAGTHDTGLWGANLQNTLSPPSRSRFGANRPSFGSHQQQFSSSNLNRVVSPNSGYIPPRPSAPSNQGYNYAAPSAPVSLYQPPVRPPPTTTTTTTRRPPPPPPSGLYQTPVQASPSNDRFQQQAAPSKGDMIGMPYEFAYGVNDQDSGNHFSRQESHNGNVMRGQYKVLLPDGRTQVVTYFDDGNGFNAEVTYE